MAPRNPGGSGGAKQWATNLTSIKPNEILLRGYRLDDLMGRMGFGEAIYVLLIGEVPTPSVGRLMDAMLVSFIDHGVTPPSTLAARNVATTGASIRGAVAAGVLGFGPHHGGDALACRALLDEGLQLCSSGIPMTDAARNLVDRLVKSNDVPPPGFGHRYHTIDPRAKRLLQLAHELEVDHAYSQLLRAIEHALSKHDALTGRPLPINIDGAIAAVCGDMGLPSEVADALLIISRVPGLAAHALEEQRREAPMRVISPTVDMYDGPAERPVPGRRK
jgi:citryl-CoA lyase